MDPVVKKKGTGRKILGVLAALFILLGLYWGLVKAPPDAFQGDVQRIMYLHIPSILTAYLSFFIVFVGSCLFLWKGEHRGAVCGAIIGIIGFLDIPLIHMSVYWWRTLHQPPSILRPDKLPSENIDWSMLVPLLINFVAFFLLFFYLLSLRIHLGETEYEIKRTRLYGET